MPVLHCGLAPLAHWDGQSVLSSSKGPGRLNCFGDPEDGQECPSYIAASQRDGLGLVRVGFRALTAETRT